MTAPILTARGVSKWYGSTRAIEDLSFEAFPGEIVGLLGPNGAGKTTAIRVLTTILRPSSGEFAVSGIPNRRAGEIRRRVGVLPEASGYPESMTGERYIGYHARLFGRSRRDAGTIAATLLGEVGLADRASARIATYSRGMRQRLGIARALVNDPQVIFLDEPTLGLDPAGQRQVLGLIREIATKMGALVILSTHLLVEVEEVCSRVLILNRGKVVAQGSIEEIKRAAAVPRMARFEVSLEMQEAALAALANVPAIAGAKQDAERRGWLVATFHEKGHLDTEADGVTANAAIQALIDAGVSLLAFEIEGARLSDAFLSITEEA